MSGLAKSPSAARTHWWWSVADHEGDIQECFVAAPNIATEKAHFLVRAKENRRLTGEPPAYLGPTLTQAPIQLCYTLELPARPGRAAV